MILESFFFTGSNLAKSSSKSNLAMKVLAGFTFKKVSLEESPKDIFVSVANNILNGRFKVDIKNFKFAEAPSRFKIG